MEIVRCTLLAAGMPASGRYELLRLSHLAYAKPCADVERDARRVAGGQGGEDAGGLGVGGHWGTG